MSNAPDRIDIAQMLNAMRNDNNFMEWVTACVAMADLLTHEEGTRTAFLTICGLDATNR